MGACPSTTAHAATLSTKDLTARRLRRRARKALTVAVKDPEPDKLEQVTTALTLLRDM